MSGNFQPLSQIHSVTKKYMHPERMSYNHETSHVYSVWKDKQMIKNSEQKIISLRSYGMKKVKNH